jgi:hypothetical protein
MNRPDPTAHDSKVETMFDHYRSKQVDAMASEPPQQSPTSDFLDALHTIHAVNPLEAVKPLREEKGLWEGEAKRVLRDGNSVAVYIGTQPGFGELPAFDMFNLTRAIGEYGVGSTVGVATLARLGYSAPRKTSTPPTPQQAAADLAHDERTEGYARRPFRTNIHD